MHSLGWYFQAIKQPRKGFWVIIQRFMLNHVKNDKVFISVKYYFMFGRRMDWNNPRTFNEKLNWMKVYYRHPIFTEMADKYQAKLIAAEIIGDEHIVPCYGVWEDPYKIDLSKLPDQFVLKGTHNSGAGMVICKDKSKINAENVCQRLCQALKDDHFYWSREWPYKNIPHRILAEKFLDDHTGKELKDYKWWCFNGVPVYMYHTLKSENKSDIYENFFDMNHQPVMIDHGFPRHMPEPEKPAGFEIMKQLAAKLSKGMPFIRIDFFDIDGHVYFGEFTFYDWGGFCPFGGDWDNKLGCLIDLNISNQN